LQQLEMQRDLQRLVLVKKQDLKPAAADKLALWLSTGRQVDGLWVGTLESKPALRRVEDALQLIKQHDSLHYSRAIHNLQRIWVHLLPNALACYNRSLKACELDTRFVLLETTTLERIASTIVHEATHAKLEGRGISYDDEKKRSRIEAICLRRELSFISKLPHCEPLRDEITRTLEWCAGDHDYFSDVNFQQRYDQGQIETARHVGIPDWFVRFVLNVRAVISGVHRLVHRFAGRPPGRA
jgi:hypothetical protein